MFNKVSFFNLFCTLFLIIIVLLPTPSSSVPSSFVINVHPDGILANLSNSLIGVGIEDVNHELMGGISTQLIFGESFEEPMGTDGISGSEPFNNQGTKITWSSYGTGCTYDVLVNDDPWTGTQSQVITNTGITPYACGIMNQALDTQGMVWKANQVYSGYFAVKILLPSDSPVTLQIQLIDTVQNTSLAISSVTVPASSNGAWSIQSFSNLIPNQSTTCSQTRTPISLCAPNVENVCVSCSGAFVILVDRNTTIVVDQVYLASNTSLPSNYPSTSRADAVSLLSNQGYLSIPGLGLTALRLGGSAILVDEYRWKRFRGPQAYRQPYTGFWYPYSSSGWGMFEYLELCEYIRIQKCVITLNSAETMQDMNDFVEYVYGDAKTTVWGAQRAEDGHPIPYQPFWIELGNEQDHTSPVFIEQVTGLANSIAKAQLQLQLPFRIGIIVGGMYGTWPTEQAVPMATSLANLSSILIMAWDFHIGGDNPTSDPDVAFRFLSDMRTQFSTIGSSILGAVLEENGSRHDIQRALGHARNSNRLRCLSPWLIIESAANGLQTLGRNDNNWDQGQVFLTQGNVNGMVSGYLSPAGMAQTMLSYVEGTLAHPSNATDYLVQVDAIPLVGSGLDVISVLNEYGDALNLRIVNPSSSNVSTLIIINDCILTNTTGIVYTLTGELTDQNLPSNPLYIQPILSYINLATENNAISFNYTFPTYSFVTMQVSCSVQSMSEAISRFLSFDTSLLSLYGTSTCASSSLNFTWNNHVWSTYNNGPWTINSGTDSVQLYCNSHDCYDEAILIDQTVAPFQSYIETNLTIGTPPNPNLMGIMDTGLLVRCIYPGIGPGMDNFNCYEVSVCANSNNNQPNTGCIILGAHWEPSNFQMLRQITYNVPTNVPLTLGVNLTSSNPNEYITFDIFVNGVHALQYNDSSFVNTINGNNLGIRSFYDDTVWWSVRWTEYPSLDN